MKCTYGLSSKLPSFFDKKHFSCSQGCLTRNVVDICDEESLIIETVQETLQKTLTPLLERAMNVPSLSDRIISVLENSHLDDDVTKTKFKNAQTRKKMKRRKKRRSQTKCDIIREGEVHAHRSFSSFENEYLLNNISKWQPYVSGKEFMHSYDNNSFSHITSEKESAYSENKMATAVRKRKKLQRRKKRKQKTKPNTNSINSSNNLDVNNIPYVEDSVTGKDNLGSYHDDDEDIYVEIPSESFDHVTDDIPKLSGQPGFAILTLECESNVFQCAEVPQTTVVQTYDSNKLSNANKNTINADSNTTVDCDTTIIVKNTGTVGKNDNHGNMSGDDSTTNNVVVGGGHFSKEQKRQFRRKMRNVKKRPETYVVLGLI